MKVIIKDPAELGNVAKQALEHFSEHKKRQGALVMQLSGELGAGKTTFSQAFAKELGVEDAVASPTFVIEKMYQIPTGHEYEHLIHIDAYRLETADELRALGWDDIVANPKNIILIEWPEKVQDIFIGDHPKIFFTHVSENVREVSWE